MASHEQPLDELIWRNQDVAVQLGGVHENTVLYYFAKSPFFDPTSNNGTIESQAMFNPDMLSILETREAFESHLEKLNGIEYRVHLGPRDFGPEAPIGEGLWVIRKQNRRIIYGQGGGAAVDAEITLLATYFVMGESVYAAPSVNKIVASRLLSTTSALNQLYSKVSALPLFSPSLGHHYIPPTMKSKSTAQMPHIGDQSREATPAHDNASQTSAPSKGNPTKTADLGILLDAYNQFNAFGHEYMDENPLQGEPGSFVFSSSREHVRAEQEAAAKRAKQQADLKKAQDEAKQQLATSRAQSAAPATPKVMTEPSPSGKLSRAEKRPAGHKPKRRKSRAPPTPMAETPVSTPG